MTFRVHAIQGVGEKDFIDLGGEIKIVLYSVSNTLRVNSTILHWCAGGCLHPWNAVSRSILLKIGQRTFCLKCCQQNLSKDDQLVVDEMIRSAWEDFLGLFVAIVVQTGDGGFHWVGISLRNHKNTIIGCLSKWPMQPMWLCISWAQFEDSF